jgi:monoamine oxidase
MTTPASTTSTCSADVVIIGAGAAGLYAAALLQQHNVDVVVLEARDRIGGRLLSVEVAEGRVDLAATWFWANEPRITRLVSDSELPEFQQHLAGDMMFQQDESGAQRMGGNQLDSPSGRLALGMQSIPEFLVGQLTDNTVRLNTIVSSISADGDLVIVATNGESWSASHVIVAVPPALAIDAINFGDNLGDLVAGLARSTPVWMGSTVKAVAVFDRPFWRDDGLAGSAFSYTGPMRELHDMSGPDGHPAAIFGFCALDIGAAAPTKAEITVQLVELFGPKAANPTDVFVLDWRAESFTSPPMVERLTNYQMFGHPEFQKPAMGGRMHWASTETSTVAPGHIEGAFAAAERAVAAIEASHIKGRP